MVDLTKLKDDNPAVLLQAEYSGLMTFSNLSQLKEEATVIVKASSISDKNLAKWLRTCDEIGDLNDFRMYVTNFILAASGNRVWSRRGGEHDETRKIFR